MTAAQVLDGSSFWLLVSLMAVASLAAILASVAAWRAARSARVALAQLEAARREVVVTDHEWQERSPIPRRASDAPTGGVPGRPPARGSSSIPPPAPPVPVPEPTRDTAEAIRTAATESFRTPAPPAAREDPAESERAPAPPVRRSDMLEDPDRGGGAPAELPLRRVTSPPPKPDDLRTEPFSRPRQSQAPNEREVEPGVFVTTPGGTPAVPGPATSGQVAPAGTSGQQVRAEAADRRLEKLVDPDPFVRIGAMEQLRGHPGLVDALIQRLGDDYPVVRRQAVRALREAGTPEATRALLDVAGQDPSAEVREEAVLALAAMLGGAKGQPGSGAGQPRNGTDET